MTEVRSTFWPSLLAAGVLHAAAGAWIATRTPPRLQVKRLPTAVRLAARERPRPPDARPRPTEPVRPPLTASTPRTAAPRPDPARPAAPPPPGTPPPTPRRFAVSMDAVVSSGSGVAVPTTTGATAPRGDPGAPADAPVGDNVPFAARAADLTDLDQPPRLLRQPSRADLRSRYPEAARREGIEANVLVELLLDDTGAVRELRIVAGGGAGFDDAVRQLARLLAFAPGTRAGRPVAVRYPWTFKFRLNE